MGTAREIIRRATLRVGISSMGEICGRAVNLLMPFSVIALYGTNILTDSFFLTIAVAFFAQGTLGNAMTSALVPEFVKNSGRHSLYSFFLWPAIAGVLVAAAAFTLALEPLTGLASVVAILSAGVMAICGLTAAPAIAALNADHRYGMPGFTWMLRILPVVIYWLLNPDASSLHWLLAGLAIADTARLSILLWSARHRLSLRIRFTPLRFPMTAQHLILASMIAGLTPLTARWIASFGIPGTVTLFETADRIYSAVASLATIGTGNVTLVYLAHLHGTDNEQKGWSLILWTSIAWSLLWLFLGILIWAIFPYFTIWINPSLEIASTAIRNTFLALALGIPAFVMTSIFSRRLITLGLSKSLVFMAITGSLASVLGSALFFFILGISGIAISITCTQYIVAWLMFQKLSDKSPHAHTHPG